MAAAIQNIQSALVDAGVDAWLFYDFRHSNTIAYDVLGVPATTLATRRWFCIVPARGPVVKIVHAIENWVLDGVQGEKRVYSDWRSLGATLSEALSGCRRIAMEYSPGAAIPTVSCVDAGTIEWVRSMGPEIVSSADFVQRFQAAWTDAQIADNLAAARVMRRLVDDAFSSIGDALRGGSEITEFDVQQFLLRGFAAHDLVTDHPPICAVNANAALPHYAPSAAVHSPIRRGDVVLIDWWARPRKDDGDGTYVDLTWMGVADSAPGDEYRRVFEIVRDARDAALALVRTRFAGNVPLRGFEVDDAARTVISSAGFGDRFVHRTGHSIYTEDHGRGVNMDNFETHDERVIIPRTSFSIEPGIYLEGRFGVRSEIDVVIDPAGKVLVPCEPIQQEIVRILA